MEFFKKSMAQSKGEVLGSPPYLKPPIFCVVGCYSARTCNDMKMEHFVRVVPLFKVRLWVVQKTLKNATICPWKSQDYWKSSMMSSEGNSHQKLYFCQRIDNDEKWRICYGGFLFLRSVCGLSKKYDYQSMEIIRLLSRNWWFNLRT